MPKQLKPRRTQAERTRASREKIIHAATELFAEQGFRGATMAEIARRARLTEPGLLHHFPSKNHLLMAVLAERDRVDSERFDASRLGDHGDLISSLLQVVEHNETVPGLVQLFTILVAESIQEQHPGHQFFLRRYQNARKHYIDALTLAQEKGEVRTDISAEDLSSLIFSMMDGLQIQWLFEPDEVDMARLFRQFVQLLKPAGRAKAVRKPR